MVAPGIHQDTENPEATHEALAKLHPVGRMGEPGDIVEAVLYLKRINWLGNTELRPRASRTTTRTSCAAASSCVHPTSTTRRCRDLSETARLFRAIKTVSANQT